MYKGAPGDVNQSELVKTFTVKAGIPGERPTPLPKLLNREYWVITDKWDAREYPETAPYFLKLDIPVSEEWPYGPVPYDECAGQCDWELPGYFGLHGVNGDETKLSAIAPGSSGCVRHRDEDITYLFNTVNPQSEKVRYYVEDD